VNDTARDPRVRIAAALAAIGIAAAAPRPIAPLAVAAVALAAAWRRRGARVLRLLGPACLLGAVAAAGTALAPAGAGAPGRAVLVFSRVLAGTAVSAWLAASVTLRELLGVLAWARCPAALLEIISLAHRQVGALGAAAASVRDAQRARLGYASLAATVRSAGLLGGALASRALDGAAATAECLAVRGDPGLAGIAPPRWSGPRDARAAAAVGVALAASAALAWGLPW
jgi:cobalt/nickel transport system permease protein